MSLRNAFFSALVALISISAAAEKRAIISVDTSEGEINSQTLILHVIDDRSPVITTKIYPVSTGMSESRTPSVSLPVNPVAVTIKYQGTYAPAFHHSVLFKTPRWPMIIASAEKRMGRVKKGALPMPITYCIDNRLRCSRGPIYMQPEDAHELYELLKPIPLTNIKINVKPGLNRGTRAAN